MRLDDRPCGPLVAQETAQIGERRTGDGELAVQNRSDTSMTAIAAQQQVSFVKVAVHVRSFGIQSG